MEKILNYVAGTWSDEGIANRQNVTNSGVR